MTNNNDTNTMQASRPFARGLGRYDALTATAKAVAATQSKPKELFTMNITATTKEGECMDDERQFLIDLVFQPVEPGLKLRLAERQLLLSYIGEILKEVEAEEKLIIEEEKTAKIKEEAPCT